MMSRANGSSPNASERPIDLTDAPFVVDDDDDDEDYVPESLRGFVKSCEDKLYGDLSEFRDIADTNVVQEGNNNAGNTSTFMSPDLLANYSLPNPVAQLSDTQVKMQVHEQFFTSPMVNQPAFASPPAAAPPPIPNGLPEPNRKDLPPADPVIDVSNISTPSNIDPQEVFYTAGSKPVNNKLKEQARTLSPLSVSSDTKKEPAKATNGPIEQRGLDTLLAQDAAKAGQRPPTPSSDVTGPLPPPPIASPIKASPLSPSPLSTGSAKKKQQTEAVVWEATAHQQRPESPPKPNRMQSLKRMIFNKPKEATPPRHPNRSRVAPDATKGDGWGARSAAASKNSTAPIAASKKSTAPIAASPREKKVTTSRVSTAPVDPTTKSNNGNKSGKSPKSTVEAPKQAGEAKSPGGQPKASLNGGPQKTQAGKPKKNPEQFPIESIQIDSQPQITATSTSAVQHQHSTEPPKSSRSGSSNGASKAAAKFTAASVERLSRPRSAPGSPEAVLKSPVSQPKAGMFAPTSPIAVVKSPAKFTSASAERLSKPKQELVVPNIVPEKKKSPTTFSADAAERLSQPKMPPTVQTQVAEIPHEVKALNSESHLLQATAVSLARKASKGTDHSQPDHSADPSTVKELPPTSHLLQSTAVHESRKMPSKEVKPLSPVNPDKVQALDLSSHLLKGTSASEAHKSPIPVPRAKVVTAATYIAPSSHLLVPTAVSAARKTTAKAPTNVEPPQKRVVAGTSSRLLKRTASSQKHIDDGVAKARARIRDRLRKENEMDSSSSHRRQLTVPKEPKFASSTRKEKPDPTDRRSPHMSLAMSSASFGKGLRGDTKPPVATASSQRPNITIPSSPRFSVGTRHGDKAKRKATNEVAWSDSSRALEKGLRSAYVAPKLHTKKTMEGLTIAASPKFTSKKRRELPKSASEMEAEKMEHFRKHPFKARPMPGNPRTSARLTVDTGSVPTYLKPTKVHLARQSVTPKTNPVVPRPRTVKSVRPTVEPPARVPFKARPVPQSTYNSRNKRVPSTTTGGRLTALTESAKKRTQLTAKMRAGQADPPKSLASPSFNRPLTHPKPFRLSSVSRHEQFRKEQEERLAEEEKQLRLQTVFKAKPLPKSTYKGVKISPKHADASKPMGPALQLGQRAKDREKFDTNAQSQRAQALAEKCRREQERQAEEFAELQERRRRPTTEGGLIPVAKPLSPAIYKG